MKSIKYFVAAILVMAVGFGVEMLIAPPVQADDTGSAESVSCIQIRSIKNIEVVDNQTILFHMLGNKTYENKLPFPLQGLKFEGGITYETSLDKLCDKDIITVIRRPDTIGPLGVFTLYVEESEETATE